MSERLATALRRTSPRRLLTWGGIPFNAWGGFTAHPYAAFCIDHQAKAGHRVLLADLLIGDLVSDLLLAPGLTITRHPAGAKLVLQARAA